MERIELFFVNETMGHSDFSGFLLLLNWWQWLLHIAPHRPELRPNTGFTKSIEPVKIGFLISTTSEIVSAIGRFDDRISHFQSLNNDNSK